MPHKWQFVYIVGWDFSPTFLVVCFDNKCWTKVQHSDSISPHNYQFVGLIDVSVANGSWEEERLPPW